MANEVLLTQPLVGYTLSREEYAAALRAAATKCNSLSEQLSACKAALRDSTLAAEHLLSDVKNAQEHINKYGSCYYCGGEAADFKDNLVELTK